MLRVTLAINDTPICDLQVRNAGETHPGEARYDVSEIIDGSRTGPVLFSVHHFRRHGAEALAESVLRNVRGTDWYRAKLAERETIG